MLRATDISLRSLRAGIGKPFRADSISVARVFRHRDFRLLWFGALFSFMGSWIQNVAQGYLVYEITGSKAALALVSFLGMIPVTFLGPIAGGVVDALDKRKLLVITQIVLAIGPLVLAVLAHLHIAKVWHIEVVALVSGATGAFEMPSRQSVVGTVVPPEDLSAALPMQALPFNLARVVGPAIGGWLVARFGAESCYLLNGLSFGALVFAALAIRADLKPKNKGVVPLLSLVQEGWHYVTREDRLRRLFLYETALSFCGLFYLSMLPAIAKDILRFGPDGLGGCYTANGVGAVLALAIISTFSSKPFKGTMVKIGVTLFALALVALAHARTGAVAYPIFAVLGFSAVIVFNTTNLLFQLISPVGLRGRAISMHVWAISGIGPFGVYLFGQLSQKVGIDAALQAGGGLLLAVSGFAWLGRRTLEADPLPPVLDETTVVTA